VVAVDCDGRNASKCLTKWYKRKRELELMVSRIVSTRGGQDDEDEDEVVVLEGAGHGRRLARSSILVTELL
jgi:hypothetical protein